MKDKKICKIHNLRKEINVTKTGGYYFLCRECIKKFKLMPFIA